ncbi:ParB family protein [Microbacterium rhizomatis]|uniref:ParB family protein n=1 Tax=Microbacterium rhizomatis TaxID=1631477 RepID=UPI0024838004|nr:hypothetical protein [Microbacterium rhizomatis]
MRKQPRSERSTPSTWPLSKEIPHEPSCTPRIQPVECEPVRPPHCPRASQEAPAPPLASTTPAELAQSATAPQSAVERATKPGKPPKFSIHEPPDDSARTRGVIVAHMRNVGMTNLSRFANEAIMKKVEQLEAQYNGGKPFEPVGPGVIPVGRPRGSTDYTVGHPVQVTVVRVLRARTLMRATCTGRG